MNPSGIIILSLLLAKWNMATGEIVLMKYEHPDIKKKRMSFAISVEHGLYVECYSYHDLMSICTLDGELKHKHLWSGVG